MRRAIVAAALLAAFAGPAAADEVWLKGGGRIVGDVIDRTPDAVVVDVGPGTIKMPMHRVERVVGTSSRLSEFRRRASRLNPQDVQGWLALASWADQNDLRTQARGAYEQVVAVDPGNGTAHQGLGNVYQDGRWMDRTSALRAQGLVEIDGNWMSPAEADARYRAQAAALAAQHENAVNEARLADAQARAREAEARARSAEREAIRAEQSGLGGIPYGGYGAVGYDAPVFVDPVQPCCGGHHRSGFCPSRRRLDPPPQPQPTPRPQRDGNGNSGGGGQPTPPPKPRRTAG